MKKHTYIHAVLGAALIFSVTACGDSGGDPTGSTSNDTPAATDPSAGTTDEPTGGSTANPTTVDPTMAPPGKHFMSVFVQYVPYKLAEQPWTPEMKAKFEADVLDTIEMNAPGFKELILHCQTRTPWDIENEVGLTEGNIFQGELTIEFRDGRVELKAGEMFVVPHGIEHEPVADRKSVV